MRGLFKSVAYLLAFGCLILPQRVYALEITVSENGSGSSSEASVSENNTTVVSQENTTHVENVVSVTSDSGSNQVTESNQSASVVTGNSTSHVEIANQQNTNTLESTSCCRVDTTTVTISGNGEGSTNTVGIEQHTTQTIEGENNAVIINNFTIRANTGNNTIKDTNGNATIETGNATVQAFSSNRVGMNEFNVVSNTNSSSVQASISSNGINSVNTVLFSKSNDNTVRSVNNASLLNTLNLTANTGDNHISGVGGVVSLRTGNASVLVSISNEVNSNKTKIENCCITDPSDPGDPGHGGIPSPTGTIGSSSQNNTSGSSGTPGIGGSTLGAWSGDVLPATGSNLSFWATIFNVFMLLFGLYLRRTAGRSPATQS